MPDKWPSLYEQINAVLAAPIPFFLAVIVVAVIMWRGGEWLYRSVLNKRKELYDLSRLEVDHWKDRAELTAAEAKQQVEQIEVMQQRPAAAEDVKAQQEQIDQLKQTISRLTGQLGALGQANSSGPTGPTGPAGPMDWTSSGWKPRNPTNVTGRSG
jgi:hypothetical protein